MTRRNLSLVKPNADTEAAVLSEALVPTMPVVPRTSLFIEEMKTRLRDAESDMDIVEQQVDAEHRRYEAVLEAERHKHEATLNGLGWQRDDLTNVADRCKAALHE